MDATYARDKLAADRIVLLGVLILGVLVAHVIVSVRSKIEMSSPIKLELAGLSIAMPSGEGWSCEDRWRYSEGAGGNVYALGGVFVGGQRRHPSASVVCVCRPGLEVTEPEERFKDLARQIDGRIVQAGTIESGAIPVEWVRISEGTGLVNMVCGTAVLPYNRQLDIQVREGTGDFDWARIVFEHIVCSARLDGELLKASGKLVESVKSRGVGSFLRNKNRQRLFVVENDVEASVGFKIDVFVEMGAQDELPIQAAGAFYLKSENIEDHAASFYTNDDVSQFVWKSRTINTIMNEMVGSSSVDVVLDGSGVMTATMQRGGQRRLRPGPLAVPKVLIELFVAQMLEKGIEQCIVDMIDENGGITPVLISQTSIEQAEELAGDDQIEYGAKLEYQYLDGRDHYRLLYLDSQKRVLLEVVNYEQLLFFKRADAKDVAREFPERADLILRGDGLRERLERYRDKD